MEELSQEPSCAVLALSTPACQSSQLREPAQAPHVTKAAQARGGEGTSEVGVSTWHRCPQDRGPGEPQGKGCGHSTPSPPRDEPAHSWEGTEWVLCLPSRSQEPPIPTTRARKPLGARTSLTAWASLSAWGRGARAAFLEGKGG